MQQKFIIINSRLKQLFKTLYTAGLVVFGLSLMSFTEADTVNGIKSNNNDTLTNKAKGFKTLLTNNSSGINTIGAISPRAMGFVEEYARKRGEELLKMREWAKPYFDLYDEILEANGVPKEMKYLSVIESNLKAGTISWAGAAGPWQLMSSSAQDLGLKVSRRVDQRFDYVKSTQAAATMLKDLHEQFGDWLLVVAAYNAGPGRVQRAIKKNGSKNFWDIEYSLPAETRNHVKKYIATHYIFEGRGGITTVTAQEAENFKDIAVQHNESAGIQFIEISGRYNSSVIAKSLIMDIVEFNRLNPYFDKSVQSGQTYQLKLPIDKADLFKAKKQQILQESVQLLLSSVKA